MSSATVSARATRARHDFANREPLDIAAEKAHIYLARRASLDPRTLELVLKLSLTVKVGKGR